MHMRRGDLVADLNWITSGDPNKKSGTYKRKAQQIDALDKRITQLRVGIDTKLTDCEMNSLLDECKRVQEESIEISECVLSIKYKPPNIYHNHKALDIRTEKFIPDDIRVGLGFGWKFLFPFPIDNNNLPSIVAQLEQCIDESIPILSQHEAGIITLRNLRNHNAKVRDFNVQWLSFTALRTKRFFNTNKDIFATRSDKGGHTVILDVNTYNAAIDQMLNNSSYTILDNDPTETLSLRELKLSTILKNNYRTKEFITHQLEYKTNNLAKFYGLVKTHKTEFKLRPIISMSGSPGHFLGKVFDRILKFLFPRSTIHIKDSYEMRNFIKTATIKNTHILVSFDVVSMYTNIPRKLVMDILLENSNKFHEKFGIGRRILILILEFLLIDSTVFTANDKIYKQNEGLPMGGCISTTLARLVMDRISENLLTREPEISFLKIFVDDTVLGIEPESVQRALNILNEFHPMIQFTHELEKDGAINFLNLTIIRNGNSLQSNWFRKPFASGRLLNYFSAHKRSVIFGTARGFIETVLKLSEPEFFNQNKTVVEETLRMNNFPETTILGLMNKFYTHMRDNTANNSGKTLNKYKTLPHAISQTKGLRKTLNRLKFGHIKYADSTKNTKINFITTRKTKTNPNLNGNLIVTSKCKCKEKKIILTHTGFNETGKMAGNRILTKFSKCNNIQGHAFKKANFMRGLFYKKQTMYYKRIIQWKHRKNAIFSGSLPNYYLGKLISPEPQHTI